MTFWDLFWLLFVFIPLTLLWVWTFIDVFGRPDLSGGSKALWIVAVILFPFFGALIYWITRPPVEQQRVAAPAQGGYRPSPERSIADELERLARLRDQGAITQQEYDAAKARILGTR